MAAEQNYPDENELSRSREAMRRDRPGDEYEASSRQMTSQDKKEISREESSRLRGLDLPIKKSDVNTVEKIGTPAFKWVMSSCNTTYTIYIKP